MPTSPNSFRTGPDERGHFGLFGGRYVAETLMPLILDLEKAYNEAKADPQFQGELNYLLAQYAGRPSPLYYAERLTKHLGGAKIYFKRDELNHTGSHKINNVLGQVLLAKRMGKTRVIAETGAGQHGVATATACALFDIPCVVFMGSVDVDRQAPNVVRMKMLGAEVRPVTSGSSTLKDAMNEALRDWVATCETTFYCIGTVAGPHPYPTMVRDFQCVIGNEVRKQIMEMEGRLPDTLVACIGGGSNAMGLFHPFLDDKGVRIIGVEAGGKGVETGEHAASLTGGRPGVLHGNRTYLLAGQGRPDHRGAFDLGRPRLSRHRARAFVAQGAGPRRIRVGDRQRGADGLPAPVQARGHHPGTRARACAGACHQARADSAEGQSAGDESLRPRRQGRVRRRRAAGHEGLR